MKLSDVENIAEVHSEGQCNTLLNQGWHLLAIHQSRHPRHSALYILGVRTHLDVSTDAPALTDTPAEP